jgi:hypothetical protein
LIWAGEETYVSALPNQRTQTDVHAAETHLGDVAEGCTGAADHAGRE